MKIVYIAHPVGGDVDKNVKKIKKIIRKIQITEPDIIPFAPYLIGLMTLDDSDKTERTIGINNNREYFKREGLIWQLWLYGNKISKGMTKEMILALDEGIPIISKTIGTSHWNAPR